MKQSKCLSQQWYTKQDLYPNDYAMQFTEYISSLSCSNPDLFLWKQTCFGNISKKTQTCFFPRHNEDKLCMYAARGDTKHYSKSIQPVGLCSLRGEREAAALPLWSKTVGLIRSCSEAETLSILTFQKLVSAFCASWINRARQEFGYGVKGSESPQAFFDIGGNVSFPL